MTSLTFENESFAVEASKEAGCRLLAKVTVKPEQAKKAYKKAVKKVNKQISIPGFRTGRAPDSSVISRYSSYVEQEWKEILVNEAYKAALELSDIYPMNKESIQKPKIETCSQEEGAVIQISYEHYPEVPAIDFSEIFLPEIKKETVPDERVQEILEEVRRSQADWEDVEGRAVEVGDYVDVSIDSLDEEPPKSIVKDRRFEVEDKKMAPWLRKLLVGKNVGESVEGISEVDENADESIKKKFKATHVRITLHAIKKIILSDVNDELAKKVGAESKEDLLKKIRHNLEREVEEMQYAKRVEALEKALLEKYPFDLPFSVIESQRRERIKAKIQALKSENLSDEEIKAREKEIEKQVSHEVDGDVRLYFLNKQIAKQGNLSLSSQELNDEIVRHINRNPQYYGRDMDKETSKELVSQMAASLMQRKAKEYALSQVLAKV